MPSQLLVPASFLFIFPCPFPKVRITNSTDPFVAPDHNIQEEKTLQVEGNFVLEVPLGTGNITVEAVIFHQFCRFFSGKTCPLKFSSIKS